MNSQTTEVTNVRVLYLTCFCFTTFCVAEFIAGIYANSLSLIGDASAMSIDSISYMTNIYAENILRRGEEIDEATRMWIQVWIPATSVALLIGVTVYNTYLAIQIIVLDPSSDDDVDVVVMFIFAAINALVDLVSMAGFYMNRKEIFSADNKLENMRVSRLSRPSMPFAQHLNMDCSCGKDDDKEKSITPNYQESLVDHTKGCPQHGSIYDLNMLSAFTHVFGDTMRTFAIFGAAVAATAGHQKGALCDAWAMVVSTITIIAMLIPLMKEIWKAAHKQVV